MRLVHIINHYLFDTDTIKWSDALFYYGIIIIMIIVLICTFTVG
ncbi:hypothetical protein JOC34_000511 [Virgibacillus halotolerans]|nr:hypothetical protein [Virgibacillus halotolerans]MBM7598154.1 hypothetical protein [Virgibacillus halotolerans]